MTKGISYLKQQYNDFIFIHRACKTRAIVTCFC